MGSPPLAFLLEQFHQKATVVETGQGRCAGWRGGGGGRGVLAGAGGTPAVLPGPPIPAAGTAADRWPPAAGPRGSAQLQELALSPPRDSPHEMSHCNGSGGGGKRAWLLGPDLNNHRGPF